MIFGSGFYRWHQFWQGQGDSQEAHLDEALGALARAGLVAWEGSPGVSDGIGPLLKKHRLAMPSAYINSHLHDETWTESVETVLSAARWARTFGATMVCTNPEPLDWSRPSDKSDAQLSTQRAALEALGRALAGEGMTLAYHVHATELRHGARELRAMLDGVPADIMGFCLDPHWLWAGSDFAPGSVEELVARYADRVVSVHARQTKNGVCTEFLEDGEIDYSAIAAHLKAVDFSGPVFIELLKEKATPETMDLEEAHRRSAEWLRAVFGSP